LRLDGITDEVSTEGGTAPESAVPKGTVTSKSVASPPNRAHFTLAEVVAATNGSLEQGFVTTEIESVSTDTRTITPGSLFVALRGERFDGHNFLQQAHAQGAIAAVIEETTAIPADIPDEFALIRVPDTTVAYGDLARAHRRRFDIPVIGITGSYGKTTTRALLTAALAPLAKQNISVLSSAGNFNNEIGVPQTLLQLDDNHVAAVIEMGMRGAGQIDYLAKVALPTVGVITNVGPQHIEFFTGFEGVVHAKAELLGNLPPDGIAIIPDNQEYSNLLADVAPCPVFNFGESAEANYSVQNIQTRSDGNISFDIRYGEEQVQPVNLPLPGAHNALNAAAALATAGQLGVPLDKAAQALTSVIVPGARMRIIKAGGLTIIDDSYNAGPDSMRAALQTLRSYPGAGRRIAVLGAMKELGPWNEAEHRKLGELCRDLDEVFGVGEETKVLLQAAGRDDDHYFTSAAEATQLRAAFRDDDVILIKGSRSVGLEIVVESVVNTHE
jgi:UDP-N-acetylmuramoyl-tripeptide--D-alanyl-D-alanine ligase